MADAAVKAKTMVQMKMSGTCPTHARTDITVRDVETVVDELDLITLTMTGTAIASLALVAIMYGRLDDVEDRLVQHDLSGPGPPASP